MRRRVRPCDCVGVPSVRRDRMTTISYVRSEFGAEFRLFRWQISRPAAAALSPFRSRGTENFININYSKK